MEISAKTLNNRFEQAHRERGWWEAQAFRGYEYAQWNRQWPGGTDTEKRIHLTFNRMAPLIHYAVGLYATSKMIAEISGREEEDQWVAEVLRQAYEFTLDDDGTHDKILDVIEDALVGGMGYLKELVGVDNNLQPYLFSEVCDPFTIFLDPDSRRPPDDLNWLIELRSVPLETAKRMFPDHDIAPDTTYQDVAEKSATRVREGNADTSTPDYNPVETKTGTDRPEEREPSVTLKEMWYKKEELTRYLFLEPEEGEPEQALGPRFEVLNRKAKEGERVLPVTSSDIWVATVVGDQLVQNEPSLYEQTSIRRKTYPYAIFCGDRIPGKPYRVGLPHRLFDVQDMYNKLNSITIDTAVRTANPGFLIPEDTMAVDQIRNLARFGSEPGVFATYRALEGAKPERLEPAPLNSAFLHLADRVSMGFDEMASWRQVDRGDMPYETSGRGIMALQRRTAQAHARIERNIGGALLRLGKLRLSNVQQFLSLELLGRITDRLMEAEDQETDATEVLNKSVGRFDIKFTIGVTQERDRQSVAEQFIALFDRQAVDRQALLEALDVPGWRAILQRIEAQDQALSMGQLLVENPDMMNLFNMLQQSPEMAQAVTAIQNNPDVIPVLFQLIQQQRMPGG